MKPFSDHPASIEPSAPAIEPPPLTDSQLAALSALARRLPASWISTPRRRRFLFLGLAAPGFFAVFGTPLHHQLLVAVVGFLLFGAAVLFRVRTETLFVRADAAELWPPSASGRLGSKESHHA
jgi:hypothetical protein